MMNGPEKSDPAIVAGKPTNKAERSAAELVERRAGTKGNAGQSSTRWTQSRISVTQGVSSRTATYCRGYPRWGPYAGAPHVRICAGGARYLASLPRKMQFAAVLESGYGPGADIDFDRAKEEPNAKGPIIIHLDTRPRRPYRSLHRVWEA